MFNVRLAGGHLYVRQLFTWLSLVVSLMASFVLSFFPLDVRDEIWDLIESVSEGFLNYFCIAEEMNLLFVCVLFVLFFLFVVVVFFGGPKQKQGRGLVDHTLVQAPQ